MAVPIKVIEKALREKRGNIAAAARALGLSRVAVYKRLESSPVLQQALTEARDTMLDNAETELYDQALSGNTTALIFFLKTQGKSRGYTERQELEHSGGVTIQLDWGDDNAND